jgi:hypothetical protein
MARIASITFCWTSGGHSTSRTQSSSSSFSIGLF